MSNITIKIRLGSARGVEQMDVDIELLRQLWQGSSSPSLLWFYLHLLLLWGARKTKGLNLGFHDYRELSTELLNENLLQRLEEVMTPLYVVLRHLQRMLLPGVSEDVRCEQEAWAAVQPDFARDLGSLPVRAHVAKEVKIINKLEPNLLPALYQAIEESDWSPRIQAHLALDQYKTELAEQFQVGAWMYQMMERGLVEMLQDSPLIFEIKDAKWEDHLQISHQFKIPGQW